MNAGCYGKRAGFGERGRIGMTSQLAACSIVFEDIIILHLSSLQDHSSNSQRDTHSLPTVGCSTPSMQCMTYDPTSPPITCPANDLNQGKAGKA
jgi:hypothetical protein